MYVCIYIHAYIMYMYMYMYMYVCVYIWGTAKNKAVRAAAKNKAVRAEVGLPATADDAVLAVEQEGLKFAGMTVDGARLVKVQRLWRSKTTGPGGRRLHAKNLSERCMFEDKLVSGLFRMSLQLGIFVLLLVALGYTSKTAHKRGLYTNFRTYPRPRRLPRSPVPRSFAHSTRV